MVISRMAMIWFEPGDFTTICVQDPGIVSHKISEHKSRLPGVSSEEELKGGGDPSGHAAS